MSKSNINTEALHEMGLSQTQDNFGRKIIRPNSKTANAAPEILDTYFEESVDPETGISSFTRMYKCEPAPGNTEPRIFNADKYDAAYLPTHDKRRIKR